MLFLRESEITSSYFWKSEITSAWALKICTKQHKKDMLFLKGSEITSTSASKAARLSPKKHVLAEGGRNIISTDSPKQHESVQIENPWP